MHVTYETLAIAAVEAKKNAIPTYSNFHVGAALLTEDDQIIKGSNVECSSYSMTICAERTAVFKAVTEGIRKFKAIAIASDFVGYISPCGACRQIIFELCGNIDVILTDSKMNLKIYKAGDLLPFAFTEDSLPKQL